MSLITKEVEVTVGVKTDKYYESLGYEIPKIRNKYGKIVSDKEKTIKVRVDELSQKSHVRVKIQCDDCKKEYSLEYNRYLNSAHDDGKIFCKECATSRRFSGENNPNWNINIADKERITRRKYPEYIRFVKKVLSRDDYTCQCCGKKIGYNDFGGAVHHIDGYDWCKEKRVDETNGITLCDNCHKNFHFVYGYGNNTRDQFEEWIGYTIKNLKTSDHELLQAREIICINDNIVYKSASDLSAITGMNESNFHDCCKREQKSTGGKKYLYYDEYIKMSDLEINEYIKWANKDEKITSVIELRSKKVFNSIIDACLEFNLKNQSGISACCNWERAYSGKLLDGSYLVWMYYDEYQKMINNGLSHEDICNKKNVFNQVSKNRIVCMNDKMAFINYAIAERYYHLNHNVIKEYLSGQRNHIGVDENNKSLKFMRYEDYIKLYKDNVEFYKQEKISLEGLMEKACKIKLENPSFNATEIANMLDLPGTTIKRYLKKGNSLGLCSYTGKEGFDKKKKMIVQLNIETSEVISVFKGLTEVYNLCSYGKTLASLKSTLSACCKHKCKTAYGYEWMYLDEYMEINPDFNFENYL